MTSTPLGTQVATDYQRHIDVIGDTDQSASGNSILRIGPYDTRGGTWSQSAYVVLTSAERDQLIKILRDHDRIDHAARDDNATRPVGA